MAQFDRVLAAFGADDRHVAKQGRDGRAVQSGRHHQQAELGTELAARVQAQRESQVAVQAALVELVEDDDRHVLERRIGIEQADQNALGDDLDARRPADPGLQPRAVADRGADRLAERGAHAGRDGTRGEPTRLEHQDAAVRRDRACKERQWHQRALAGTGRCFEHRAGRRAECCDELREYARDRQDGQ